MQNNSKDRNINVLQLTDLHITGTEASYQKDILSIKAVYTLISRTQPDFIVLTGDVIFGYDGYSVNDGVRALNVICKVMDRIGIPWTWTFGNHDHDFFDNFSSDSIASMLSQSSTLKMYENNSQVTGYTNGVFELYNKDGTTRLHGIQVRLQD
jgi:predicted MPP superfamily phosphohydrolase